MVDRLTDERMDEMLHAAGERWRAATTGDEPHVTADRADAVASTAASAVPSTRRRTALLVSSVIGLAAAVVAAVVAVTLAGSPSRDTGPASSVAATFAAVRGVLWRDTASPGTVVFRAHTARLDDGCSAETRRLRVSDGRVRLGRRLGLSTSCAGLAAPSGGKARRAFEREQRRLTHFYQVVSGPTRYARHGNVLLLSAPGHGTLRLTTDGRPAPTLVGTTWRLAAFSSSSRSGGRKWPAPAAPELVINREAGFLADELCGKVTGTVETNGSFIVFSPVSEHAPCWRPMTPEMHVVDDLLGGADVLYQVREDRLELQAGDEWLMYRAVS